MYTCLHSISLNTILTMCNAFENVFNTLIQYFLCICGTFMTLYIKVLIILIRVLCLKYCAVQRVCFIVTCIRLLCNIFTLVKCIFFKVTMKHLFTKISLYLINTVHFIQSQETCLSLNEAWQVYDRKFIKKLACYKRVFRTSL